MKTKSEIPYEYYMKWIKRDKESEDYKQVVQGLRLLAKDIEQYYTQSSKKEGAMKDD